MSTKFYAINRETGERWRPEKAYGNLYLVMYDSGAIAVVTEDYYQYIRPLDMSVWRVIYKSNLEGLIND